MKISELASGDAIEKKLTQWLTVSMPKGQAAGVLHPELEAYLKSDHGLLDSDLDRLRFGLSLNRLTTKGLLLDEELRGMADIIPGVAGGPSAVEFAMQARKLQLAMH